MDSSGIPRYLVILNKEDLHGNIGDWLGRDTGEGVKEEVRDHWW